MSAKTFSEDLDQDLDAVDSNQDQDSDDNPNARNRHTLRPGEIIKTLAAHFGEGYVVKRATLPAHVFQPNGDEYAARHAILCQHFGDKTEVVPVPSTSDQEVTAIRWSQNTNRDLNLTCVFLYPSGMVVVI